VKQKTTSDLGQFLRDLRTQAGQTLHDVSKGADIDSPLLSKIERGERLPTLDQAKKFARYYKIPMEELKVKLTAERIIREYGINETTYNAVSLVKEQIVLYKKRTGKAEG